jgi:4-hydroxy-tetrahydrodipicolinate synthase
MLRGIFQILHTPFLAEGAIDWDSYERQIDFSIGSGVHGLVAPAMASEFFALSDKERHEIVEFAIARIDGRVPVVACVQGVTTLHATAFAEHAAGLGADALMAMPPYLRRASRSDIVSYFRSLAVVGLPIIVQNAPSPIGTPLSPTELTDLTRQIDLVRYVKEETPPILHRISTTVELAQGGLDGLFGGANGLHLVSELDRGACGNMPAGGLIDLQVRVYELYAQGLQQDARTLQRQLLDLLTYAAMYGVSFHKHVLWKRGVLASSSVRDPQAIPIDHHDGLAIARMWRLIEGVANPAYPFVA